MPAASDAPAPLYLLAVIRPRLDLLDVVEERLRVMMAASEREPGCSFMELAVDPSDATTWYMFEKFHSRADWDDHMQTEHVIAGNDFLADKLREPTELRLYAGK